MDNAPFAIGQKIVRIAPSKAWIEKGKVYTCAGCMPCPHCHKWKVFLEELPVDTSKFIIKSTCGCGDTQRKGLPPFYSGVANYFAPIQPMYENISKQIAESITQTDEVPDRVIVPQTVNN